MQFIKACDFILEKLKKELPSNLYYHTVEHVNDVCNAAREIGKAEGIDKYNMRLLETAVLFHDAGFLTGPNNHEEKSCMISKQYLPCYNYSEDEIEKICGMIMATRIPQSPKNHLEEIICDADLDYLGRDDFYDTGSKLFREFIEFGVVSTEKDWNNLQVRFLEQHHFFTNTAIKSRQGKKMEHLYLLKQKIG
jgi:predicted metal-dependent HD superfamily phosphohydrolase